MIFDEIKATISSFPNFLELVAPTAGRILAEDKSVKGKGVSTIVPFVIFYNQLSSLFQNKLIEAGIHGTGKDKLGWKA